MDKFCSACGAKHTSFTYPKQCPACSRITYSNPKPVSVLLLPVFDRKNKRTGILVGERGIEPQKGTFGLPGGYMDDMDTCFVGACVRELLEETGFIVDPDSVHPFWSFSDGRNALVFHVSTDALLLEDLDGFVACDECPNVKVIWEPEQLSFMSHTKAVERWFDSIDGLSVMAGKVGYGLELTGLQVEEIYQSLCESVNTFVIQTAQIRHDEREALGKAA